MKLQFAFKQAAAALVFGIAAMGALPASAQTVVYTFTNGGGAFPSPGNYGTVQLSQDGADVDFTVTLAAGFNFVTTGNQNSHATFSFNSTGVALSDITNIADATPVAGEYGVWSPGNNAPFGQFTWGIHCISCSNGGPGQQLDPLSFTVLNSSISDFLSLSTGGTAAYFSADIIGQGATGAVGVTAAPPPPIPEPGTYVLTLAGLAAIGFIARRRRVI